MKSRAEPTEREPEPRELEPRDYQLLAQFRYLLARFLAFSAREAHGAGLEPRQHQALLAIKGYPGGAQVTVGDLAERLSIRHHSAVGLVDRLVASGYLLRRADSTDRRRVLLALTPAAERTLAALSAAHRRELQRIAPLLGPLLGELAPPADGPPARPVTRGR